MALFTHLTSEKLARSVVRTGIRSTARGVFCLPVLPSYTLSHQWARELRRRGQRTIVAVDFRLPDDEPVEVGHYGAPRVALTAAGAVALIRDHEDPRGYEVVLARGVSRREIHRVRPVSRVVGWRYRPDAHGRTPCPCPVCCFGDYGSARIRARLGDPDDTRVETKPELMAMLAEADSVSDLTIALFQLGTRSRGNPEELAHLLDHPSAEVREQLAKTLAAYRGPRAAAMLRVLAEDPEAAVRDTAADRLAARRT
ncbi:HEAT repeat domain-containing protein [Actinosynnema sp. NPDC020468]|uniref:HEAT repeat domain-containing protein n=1 Tax=Actinosynnema sp. NPDC020468 TaxID=3154488 RepID=UPI0033C02407